MQHEHEHEGRLARMIPARKSPLIEAWFRGYVRRYLRRSFHRVLLLGEPPAMPDGPLLVCMNHSSWWDPLLVFWLSRELLSWDAYGPMDQRQLNRYPILARIGAFGVDRESLQAAREFVRYSDELLRGRRRALWLTAQGAMVSSAARPVRFYSGVASLVQSLGVAHVTTVVLEYEFWDEKRPEAFVSFATAIPVVAGAGLRPQAVSARAGGADGAANGRAGRSAAGAECVAFSCAPFGGNGNQPCLRSVPADMRPAGPIHPRARARRRPHPAALGAGPPRLTEKSAPPSASAGRNRSFARLSGFGPARPRPDRPDGATKPDGLRDW